MSTNTIRSACPSGAAFNTARRAVGLTLEDVARLTGVSERQVRRYLRGEVTNPSNLVAAAFTDLYAKWVAAGVAQ